MHSDMKRTIRCLIMLFALQGLASGADSPYVKQQKAKFELEIKYLNEGDPEEKKISLYYLSSFLRYSDYRIDQGPLNKVISYLRDKDPDIREAAAVSLKLIGKYSKDYHREEAEIVPNLITALDDGSPRVRDEAVKALGYYKDSRASGKLIERLVDNDFMVRLDAACALGEVNDTKAADALIAVLDSDMGWRERFVQREAINALRKISSSSYELRMRLIPLFLKKAEDRYLRADAIRALAYFNAEEARGLFTEASRDPDMRTQKLAAIGLTRLRKDIPSELNLEPFEKALHGPNDNDKIKTIETLARMNDKRVIGLLLVATEDSSGWVRKEAAKALGNYSDGKVFAALAGLMRDKDYLVRSEALKSYKLQVPRTALKAVPKRHTVLYVNPVALNYLLETIEKGDNGTKRDALEVVGMIEDERAYGIVKKYADDPVTDVRSSAIRAMGTMGPGHSGEIIEKLKKDEDHNVRASSAAALKQIGDAASQEALIETAVNDGENEYVRTAALSALGSFEGERITGIIIKLIDDGSRGVRWSAIYTVGKNPSRFRGRKGVLDAIVRRLDEVDVGMTIHALRTLGELGDKGAAEPMIRALRGGFDKGRKDNGDLALRKEAAYSLGVLGDRAAVDPLIEVLNKKEEDFYLRLAAANSLGRIGDPAAISHLESFLEEKFAYPYKESVIGHLRRLKAQGSRK